jgi:hypothetical protein
MILNAVSELIVSELQNPAPLYSTVTPNVNDDIVNSASPLSPDVTLDPCLTRLRSLCSHNVYRNSNDCSVTSPALELRSAANLSDIEVYLRREDSTVSNKRSNHNLRCGVVKSLHLASELMKTCYTAASKSCRISATHLKAMPPGSQRRRMLDDVTVMALQLYH